MENANELNLNYQALSGDATPCESHNHSAGRLGHGPKCAEAMAAPITLRAATANVCTLKPSELRSQQQTADGLGQTGRISVLEREF
eukprot:2913717-Karenia_brevis.AAC.1